MPIPVNCPSCGFEGEAPEGTEGQSVLCPDCRYNIPVPGGNGRKSLSYRVREDDDEDDEPPRRSRRRRRRRSEFRYGIGSVCDRCGSDAPPIYRSEISVGGWILFVVLFFTCLPLCVLGLLIKDDYRVCSDCGARL
ncbi:MAG TPA: hypothetical protein VGZ47_02470 [Gemmataceae bacterium]|jgi:hypothetical protein|nr:hypothetical protein [Gemmataceae bacterium]